MFVHMNSRKDQKSSEEISSENILLSRGNITENDRRLTSNPEKTIDHTMSNQPKLSISNPITCKVKPTLTDKLSSEYNSISHPSKLTRENLLSRLSLSNTSTANNTQRDISLPDTMQKGEISSEKQSSILNKKAKNKGVSDLLSLNNLNNPSNLGTSKLARLSVMYNPHEIGKGNTDSEPYIRSSVTSMFPSEHIFQLFPMYPQDYDSIVVKMIFPEKVSPSLDPFLHNLIKINNLNTFDTLSRFVLSKKSFNGVVLTSAVYLSSVTHYFKSFHTIYCGSSRFVTGKIIRTMKDCFKAEDNIQSDISLPQKSIDYPTILDIIDYSFAHSQRTRHGVGQGNMKALMHKKNIDLHGKKGVTLQSDISEMPSSDGNVNDNILKHYLHGRRSFSSAIEEFEKIQYVARIIEYLKSEKYDNRMIFLYVLSCFGKFIITYSQLSNKTYRLFYISSYLSYDKKREKFYFSSEVIGKLNADENLLLIPSIEEIKEKVSKQHFPIEELTIGKYSEIAVNTKELSENNNVVQKEKSSNDEHITTSDNQSIELCSSQNFIEKGLSTSTLRSSFKRSKNEEMISVKKAMIDIGDGKVVSLISSGNTLISSNNPVIPADNPLISSDNTLISSDNTMISSRQSFDTCRQHYDTFRQHYDIFG